METDFPKNPTLMETVTPKRGERCVSKFKVLAIHKLLMIMILLLLLIAVAISISFGFRSPVCRMTRSFTMTSTESNTMAQFEAIKNQINAGLTAKVQAGKAPAAFVDIVKGFVEEYAVSFIEGKYYLQHSATPYIIVLFL